MLLNLVSADPGFIRLLREALEPEGEWGFGEAEDALTVADARNTPVPPGALVVIGFQPGMLKPPFALAQLRQRLRQAAAERHSAAVPIALSRNAAFHAKERKLLGVGGEAYLTEKEAELLSALLAAGQGGMKRESLLEQVWKYHEAADTHTLETHIYRLRGKLREAVGEECVLTTTDGYALVADNK